MSNVLAIDIGGSNFRVGLFDRQGKRLAMVEHETSHSGGRDWMLEQVRDRSREIIRKSKLPAVACGISFGGPVNFQAQRVRSIHTPGWEDFALAGWAQETLKVPCKVDNDANSGALGELRFGAGKGTRSLVYITISTGVGAGFICEGKIIRGRDSMAGELGHIPVSDSEVVCSCGAKGCLEAFCSAGAIARRAQQLGERRPESITRMIELGGGKVEGISAKAVYQAAAEGDIVASQIIGEAAHWFARALLVVIRILNPDKVLLGGGVTQAGLDFLNPVEGYLKEFASPTIGYSSEIALAGLGGHSPLFGAAAMALDLAR